MTQLSKLQISRREYYVRNREQILRRTKEYAAKNAKKIAAYQLEYRTRSPEIRAKRKQQAAEWRQSHLVRSRAAERKRRLQKEYGMTVKAWDALFQQQGHQCAICKTPELNPKGQWHTDHCHVTGRVRGILCSACNQALGLMKDDTLRLKTAIAYLRKGYTHG